MSAISTLSGGLLLDVGIGDHVTILSRGLLETLAPQIRLAVLYGKSPTRSEFSGKSPTRH
jgi:hypothetical protein